MRLTGALIAAGASALLVGCAVPEDRDDPDAPVASPADGGTASVAAAPGGGPAALPPGQSRDPADLVRGCSGTGPKWRPRGSNCYGILPEQCGAHRAAAYVGEPMTPRLAARIEALAPGAVRIIRPGDAVTDDLGYTRLNVILDAQDRVAKVDCY